MITQILDALLPNEGFTRKNDKWEKNGILYESILLPKHEEIEITRPTIYCAPCVPTGFDKFPVKAYEITHRSLRKPTGQYTKEAKELECALSALAGLYSPEQCIAADYDMHFPLTPAENDQLFALMKEPAVQLSLNILHHAEPWRKIVHTIYQKEKERILQRVQAPLEEN